MENSEFNIFSIFKLKYLVWENDCGVVVSDQDSTPVPKTNKIFYKIKGYAS